ncbi:hypothetical protein [Maritalea sp.]|uniref:hypothetical protein n=1 Tax=Maritalea sp. TaxID=2003361 RepID=UPI003EF9BC4F
MLKGSRCLSLLAAIILFCSFSTFAKSNSLSGLAKSNSPFFEIAYLLRSAIVESRCSLNCASIQLPRYKKKYRFAIVSNGVKFSAGRAEYIKTQLSSELALSSIDTSFDFTADKATADFVLNFRSASVLGEAVSIQRSCGGFFPDGLVVGVELDVLYWDRDIVGTPYRPSNDLVFVFCTKSILDKIFDNRESYYFPGNDTESRRKILGSFFKSLAKMRRTENITLDLMMEQVIADLQAIK